MSSLTKLKLITNQSMRLFKLLPLIIITLCLINSVACFSQNLDFNKFKRDGIHYPGDLLTKKDSLQWPVEFDITLNIEEIKNINIENTFFESYFWFNIDSKYPAIYTSNHGEIIPLNPIVDNLLIFSGFNLERNPNKGDVQINNEDGKFSYSQVIEALINHKWNLRNFPFDTQKLNFSFITQVDTSVVRINNSPKKLNSFNENNEFLSDGYMLNKMSYKKSFVEGAEKILVAPNTQRKIVFEKITYILELSRGGSWLYIKLFFGGFISFIISWLIFLVPKRELDSRTNIAVASIFGALGNKYFVEQSLPNVQVLMKADIINNLVIVLIVFNIIMMITQANKKLKFLRIKSNKKVMVVSGLIFLLTNLIVLIW